MRMVDVIEKKRDGKVLTKAEIEFFVNGYTDGSIPDYQVSALLMAIYFQDMNDQERSDLTMTMMHSGDRLDLSAIPGVKVDKHSTGGVGDKTSIPLAPLVAALDIPVPMISGRGLGHTGGTLDKLEAIPGYQVEIPEDKFIEIVKEDKVAIVGTTGNIAPADKKIYALRDVTATVSAIPLIAGSIMSKKIASGTDALVLDVKTGSGAFMKTPADAENLARALVRIGKNVGMDCMAVISDMNQPLGYAIGNALEIKESIDILQGKGPEDITELVMILGSQMAVLGGKAKDLAEARQKLEKAIQDGSAIERFKAFVAAQGGDPNVVDHPEIMPQAKYQFEVPAKESGVVSEMVADELGIAAMELGAGRATKDDVLDYAVGLVLNKKIGDQVAKGENLVTIYANQVDVEKVKEKIYANIKIADTAVVPTLIHNIITE